MVVPELIALIQQFLPYELCLFIASGCDILCYELYKPERGQWGGQDWRMFSEFYLPASEEVLCRIDQIHRYQFLELPQYEVPRLYRDQAIEAGLAWLAATTQAERDALSVAPNDWHTRSVAQLIWCWSGRSTDRLSSFQPVEREGASTDPLKWFIRSYDDNRAPLAADYVDLDSEGVLVTCDVPEWLGWMGAGPQLPFQFVPRHHDLTVSFAPQEVPGHFTSLKFGHFYRMRGPPRLQLIHHLFILAIVDLPSFITTDHSTGTCAESVEGVKQRLVLIRTATGAARHRIESAAVATTNPNSKEKSNSSVAAVSTCTPQEAEKAAANTTNPNTQIELKKLVVVTHCDLPIINPDTAKKTARYTVREVRRLDDESDRCMAVVSGPVWYLYLITPNRITRVARFDGPTSAKCPVRIIERH